MAAGDGTITIQIVIRHSRDATEEGGSRGSMLRGRQSKRWDIKNRLRRKT